MSNTIKLQKFSQQKDVMSVERILQGRKKIKLTHAGELYVLQITSNNKLLLTK